MKKSLIVFLTLVLAISSLLVGCGDGAAETDSGDVIELITYSAWPPGNHQSKGLIEFAERMEKETDGKVKMTVHTGASLGYGGPELPKVVKDGLVDISDYVLGGAAGQEPTFGVFTLPFLIQNMEEGRVLADIAKPHLSELLETKWNQKILYTSPWPMAGFYTKNPVNTIDDLKGLQMRTYDNMTAEVVGKVGATPFALPFSEVYSALSTGAIDSVLTSSPTAVEAALWEVIDYSAPVNVAMSQDLVVINLDKFNNLPKDIQDAFIKVGEEMEARMWEEIGPELNANQESILAENGLQTVEPTQELIDDLVKATESIRTEWLEKEATDTAKIIIEEFNEKMNR